MQRRKQFNPFLLIVVCTMLTLVFGSVFFSFSIETSLLKKILSLVAIGACVEGSPYVYGAEMPIQWFWGG